MFFTAFSLIVLALTLYRNYAKDPGTHRRAKVIHALALVFIVLLGVGSFATVASQIRHFDSFRAHYDVPLGPLPGELNFLAAMLGGLFDLVLFLAAFAAAQRKAPAISVIRIVLLASIPTAFINFHRGFGPAAGVADHTSLMVAVAVVLVLKLGLFVLYGTRTMKAFVAFAAPQGT